MTRMALNPKFGGKLGFPSPSRDGKSFTTRVFVHPSFLLHIYALYALRICSTFIRVFFATDGGDDVDRPSAAEHSADAPAGRPQVSAQLQLRPHDERQWHHHSPATDRRWSALLKVLSLHSRLQHRHRRRRWQRRRRRIVIIRLKFLHVPVSRYCTSVKSTYASTILYSPLSQGNTSIYKIEIDLNLKQFQFQSFCI